MKSIRRPSVTLLTVAAVATLGLSACSSDPSPKRVAEDIVKTETQGEPEVQECMLAVIDEYGNDQLEALGKNVNEGDAAEQAEAEEALDQFEADLAACRE